jgi:hypothetical protein
MSWFLGVVLGISSPPWWWHCRRSWLWTMLYLSGDGRGPDGWCRCVVAPRWLLAGRSGRSGRVEGVRGVRRGERPGGTLCGAGAA